MRRVWFSGGVSVDEGAVSAEDFGTAPFLLLVEYVPRSFGRYRLKAQVRLRDPAIAELIARHQLDRVELYVDAAADAVDERQVALGQDIDRDMQQHDMGYAFMPHLWIWSLLRQLDIVYERQRVVRISLGRLLRGIEVKGSMDELSWLARELTHGIDRLAAKIDTGRAFDSNEVRIYAPGEKRKPVKGKPGTPGTPPSQWGE